jgi:RimJ/RimL family protein N-acetyltransferase
VSIWRTSREHQLAEIGFVFHPDHHGHGFATEAMRVVIGLGFEAGGTHRIMGRCDARNTPSAALMERLGMRREAHLRENEYLKGEWADELDYAILDREWTGARDTASRH